MSAATIGKAAELGIAGHGDRLRLEVAPALEADDAAAVAAVLDLDRRAEGGQHALGMVAGQRPAR